MTWKTFMMSNMMSHYGKQRAPGCPVTSSSCVNIPVDPHDPHTLTSCPHFCFSFLREVFVFRVNFSRLSILFHLVPLCTDRSAVLHSGTLQRSLLGHQTKTELWTGLWFKDPGLINVEDRRMSVSLYPKGRQWFRVQVLMITGAAVSLYPNDKLDQIIDQIHTDQSFWCLQPDFIQRWLKILLLVTLPLLLVWTVQCAGGEQEAQQ